MGSTIPATFMNKELVTDIQDTKFQLLMNTNMGTKILNIGITYGRRQHAEVSKLNYQQKDKLMR